MLKITTDSIELNKQIEEMIKKEEIRFLNPYNDNIQYFTYPTNKLLITIKLALLFLIILFTKLGK